MNILINGATRGIGKELARFMAGNKNDIIFATGRHTEALSGLVADMPNLIPLRFDISDPGEVKSLLAGIKEKCDRIDILVNMAGTLVRGDFRETSDEDARLMMETNFFGPARVIRSLLPLFQPGAHILNIASMGGFQGSVKFRGLSYYSASKAAIACLSECLAEELKEDGISVNCLALGAVSTEMLETAFPGYIAPVSPEELAPFIAGFALEAHRYMNGKIIPLTLSTP